MDFQIRQATPDDADALVRMHTLVHEECYARQLSPEFFRARRASIPQRIEQRRKSLATADPRLIALDDSNEVVGFADAGPALDADAPEQLELYAIYILRRTYGSGLGAALLNAAVADSPAYLWLLEDNPRALAFYLKYGFREDGERKLLPPEWEELPVIRMVRSAKP